MFETIMTLRELNSARIMESNKADADITLINNAYNAARQRILSNPLAYKVCSKLVAKARPTELKRSIPIAGKCQEINTIRLNQSGFWV